MYISRVRVENIRGFSGARNVDLTLTRPDGSHAGWTVIAGRNGSGKSSLLQAIALAVSGPSVTRSLVPDFRDWITAGQPQGAADVELTDQPEFDSWFAPEQPSPGQWNQGLLWTIPRSQNISSKPALFTTTTTAANAADGPWQEEPGGWFCAGYGPFRRLAGGSADAQRLMMGPGPISRLVTLFHEDASLTEGVQWLIGQHLRTLENRYGAQELKETAIRIVADGLLPDGYEISDVDSEGLWVTSGGHRFPLQEMSDGYRTIAALVVDLIKQLNGAYPGGLEVEEQDGVPAIMLPGVVIIDEVDAHLHVSWQKRIGGWLKEHFPNIQFIVTSHSPYVCQAADPGGLIRLPGPRENEPPRVVDDDLYERVVFGSGDDAVLSELFGLDSPYSEQAERLRRELVSLETKVMAGRANDQEVIRYKALRRQLTSSPVARADEVAARLGSQSQSQSRPQGELSGMIRITRPPLTAGLDTRLHALSAEVRAAPPPDRAEAARRAWRRTSTRVRVHGPLSALLREMAPGLEQCMYCGEDEGTDIDHFEPLARNPLRTFDWLNHLLACSVCNSHAKRDRFPVDARGRPLLIDPTAEDPFDHLLLTLSLGHYEPLTEKGEATIEVCKLNRPVLERGRVQARRVVELCLRQWATASADGDTATRDQAIVAVQEQPFADVCQAMLRQAESPGADIIFDDAPQVLALLRRPELRQALLS